MPILPQGPCLHDFLQETPLPTYDTVGVLNTITTTIAALQTTIAIKILLNKPVQPQLYHIDIWKPEIKTLQIKHNPDAHTTNYLNHNQNDCIRFCATGKFQIIGKPINLQEKKEQWEKIDTVIDDTTTLQFKNIILFPDGRALIQAATEAEARTTYSKYIGN